MRLIVPSSLENSLASITRFVSLVLLSHFAKKILIGCAGVTLSGFLINSFNPVHPKMKSHSFGTASSTEIFMTISSWNALTGSRILPYVVIIYSLAFLIPCLSAVSMRLHTPQCKQTSKDVRVTELPCPAARNSRCLQLPNPLLWGLPSYTSFQSPGETFVSFSAVTWDSEKLAAFLLFLHFCHP